MDNLSRISAEDENEIVKTTNENRKDLQTEEL
jgi:hypothetical protein